MERIKVLEVIRQGQIGGGESHVLDLIDCLDKERFEPVAMSFTGGHMIDTLQARGIKCIVIETQKAFDIKVQKKIAETIKEEKIQLIHAHGSRAASNMLYTAHKLHIPMIYTVHGWSFHQDQSWFIRKLRAWSEKLICKSARKIICVSESNKQTGIKSFGLKKSIVIENGINLSRFNPDTAQPSIRKELGIEEKTFLVGEICRLTLQKAPLDFVKSIEIAHKENPDIKGLLIGEGDMQEEVNSYIQQNQLQSIIYTSKFRTDIPAVLNSIDVYCQPSLWEGLSIALLEAMAMKKAIVATPTDGTCEVLTSNVNGTIVDYNNPDQLAKAYLDYYNNPEIQRRHGETASTYIKQRFDARRVARQVEDIYQELL